MTAVTLEARGAVAYIRLNRPQALNAFTQESFGQLNAAMDRYRDDAALRVAIVHGAGERAFSAGMDLKAYAAMDVASRKESLNLIRFADPAYCSKPVVAAIRGFCIGSGLHLALSCDFRVCASDAVFALPEVELGISLTRLSWQCARTIGMPAALELCLLAQRKDASWALAHQLVHRVTAPGEELAEAERIADRLSRMDPAAVSVTRTTLYKAFELSYPEMFDFSLPLRNAVLDAGAPSAAGSVADDQRIDRDDPVV